MIARSAPETPLEPARHPITGRVREQYERYPYPPPPGPQELRLSAFAALDYVQHVLWPGRRDLSGLRVLDAGCGTGDAAVGIAACYPEIEVVGIDLSEASLEAARAQARRLHVGDNLTLRRLPIEDAGALGGPFDYIVSCGVLHHLADPDAGLRALADLLAPTGGLGLMLYATHGRHGVYMVQELLRRVAGTKALDQQVAYSRKLLAPWRAGHPFQPSEWGDLRRWGDAGLVDLLLHAQDRSYTVPEVFDFLQGAGLRLERFYDPVLYNPISYVRDSDVASDLAALGEEEQPAVAELLHGKMTKHLFFATRATYEPLRVKPEGAVLLAMRPRRSPLWAWERAEAPRKRRARPLTVRQYSFDATARTVELDAWNARVVEHCTGDLTAAEIFRLPAVYTSIPGLTADAKLETYGRMMELLAEQGVLLFEI